MITEPIFYFTMATAGLAAIAMVTTASLSAWRGWLTLKHEELANRSPTVEATGPSAATRIELADMKERIRKLEAIAAGVDL